MFIARSCGRRTAILTQLSRRAIETSAMQWFNPRSTEGEVLFESHLGLRKVILNRPEKLNALSNDMSRSIREKLFVYEKSDACSAVLIKKGDGKSFCSGGDVVSIQKAASSAPKGWRVGALTLGFEYTMIHLLATFKKPLIAFMDGYTMGGGVGISTNSHFPVATENTIFSMPETLIGLIPDVGASFFFSRLDGQLGSYLSILGERLSGYDAYMLGLASHYVASEDLPQLEARISDLEHPTMSMINNVINEFQARPPPGYGFRFQGAHREAIDRCFKFNTVPEIIRALEAENTTWAKSTIATIRERSTLSCVLALDAIRRGKHWSFTETMSNETHIACRIVQEEDFIEGVNARLLSKPPRKPNFMHTTYDIEVKEFFSGKYTELPFEPVLNRKFQNFMEYPAIKFRLPRERKLLFFLNSHLKNGYSLDDFEEVYYHVKKRFGEKQELDSKLADVLARRSSDIKSGSIDFEGETIKIGGETIDDETLDFPDESMQFTNKM